MSDYSDTWKLGTALVDRSVLEPLAQLWEGGFHPEHLIPAELAMRAFLVAPRMVVSRLSGSPWGSDLREINPSRELLGYEEPFDDHLLDYEFTYPREPHPFVTPSLSELSAVADLLDVQLIKPAFAELPMWVRVDGQAFAYLDAWYRGLPADDCELLGRAAVGWEMMQEPFDRDVITDMMRNFVEDHAAYVIGCHRAGLLIFAASRLARVCDDHIFTQWPHKLFDVVDKEFRELAKEVNGPRIGITLPPLLAILMSRVKKRDDIPSEIAVMRQEFSSARQNLWQTLDMMWNAPTLREQTKILRDLSAAANNITPSAFPARLEALQLAVDVTSGSLGAAAKTLLTHDKPNAKVSSISFAKQFSRQLRMYVKNHYAILKQTLSRYELAAFGID